MKKSFIRAIGMGLAAVTAVALAACAPQAQNGGGASVSEVTFPLKTPVTLRYWMAMPGGAVTLMKNFSESELYQELAKRTGVNIEFLHPAVGQEKEQLGIMLASNDLPDMIESAFDSFSGGAQKAYESGLIAGLNDLQKKYAPNLTKIYDTYPALAIDAKTEDGTYLRVPFIRGDQELRTFRGPAIRKDWLDDLGLALPETIGDWYNVLTAFKEKKGAVAPYISDASIFRTEAFMGAYGIGNSYLLENGKVFYGPADPRYKEYLTEMAKWYKEGLVYSEFAVPNISRTVDEMISNGKAGASIGYIGSTVGRYLTLMKDKDPKFNMIGTQYPVLKAGDTPKIIHQDPIFNTGGAVSIASSCTEKEIAMKWLDYGYGKEGYLLFNFGVEGKSYTMENGQPKYTALITDNPDGLSFADVALKYFRSTSSGPFVQDKRYLEQYYLWQQQKDTIKTWTAYAGDAIKANTQVRGVLTSEENSSVASKQTTINTYVDEMFLKFVMGQEPLDKFDAYVEQVNRLGLQDIVSLKQKKHDEFLKNNPDALNPQEYNVSALLRD